MEGEFEYFPKNTVMLSSAPVSYWDQLCSGSAFREQRAFLVQACFLVGLWREPREAEAVSRLPALRVCCCRGLNGGSSYHNTWANLEALCCLSSYKVTLYPFDFGASRKQPMPDFKTTLFHFPLHIYFKKTQLSPCSHLPELAASQEAASFP